MRVFGVAGVSLNDRPDPPRLQAGVRRGSRLDALVELAARQAGHVTLRQALAAGCARSTLLNHVYAGRLVRVDRGVYRFPAFPLGLTEQAVGAWLGCGGEPALISHETALMFHGFRGVARKPFHLILPRSHRWRRSSADVRIHTVLPVHMPTVEETVEMCGAWVTSPVRSLVDIAAAVPHPRALRGYTWEAVLRGLARRDELMRAAGRRNSRVRARMRRALTRLPLR